LNRRSHGEKIRQIGDDLEYLPDVVNALNR